MKSALGTIAKLMLGSSYLPLPDSSQLGSSSATRRRNKRPRLSASMGGDRGARHVVELSQQVSSQIDAESSDSDDATHAVEEVCDGPRAALPSLTYAVAFPSDRDAT